MASTNKTVNLALSQYVDTDTPTYLGDYNADMLAIDNGYGELKTKSTDVEARMQTIESDTKTLKSNVEALQSNQATTSTQVSELTGKVSTNTADIATINELSKDQLRVVTVSHGGGTIQLYIHYVPLIMITFIDVRIHDVTIVAGAQVELAQLTTDQYPDDYLTQDIYYDPNSQIHYQIQVNKDTGKVFLFAPQDTSGSGDGFVHNTTGTVCLQHAR